MMSFLHTQLECVCVCVCLCPIISKKTTNEACYLESVMTLMLMDLFAPQKKSSKEGTLEEAASDAKLGLACRAMM